MPKVSIIIPAHNAAAVIGHGVRSVLSQSLADIELLCVDDASADGTAAIISALAKDDPRVSLIPRGKQGGAGAARNTGLDRAKGDYVFFFDADDHLSPDFLQSAVSEIELRAADILVFDFFRENTLSGEKTLCSGLNRRILPAVTPFCRTDICGRILTLAIPTPWNKLFRRAFLIQKGLRFQEISSTNDVFFSTVSMLEAERIAYLPKPFVTYRTHQVGSISSGKGKNLGNVLSAVQAVQRYAERHGFAEEYREALQYFAANNLIFALKNYAGKPTGTRWRRFYKQVRDVFHSPLFAAPANAPPQTQRAFAGYFMVRDNTYWRYLAKGFYRTVKKRVSVSRILKGLRALKSLPRRVWRIIRGLERELQSPSRGTAQTRALAEQTAALREETAALRSIVLRIGFTPPAADNSLRLIVTFTSYPARIHAAADVVLGILEQTLLPDKIVLWLAESEFPLGLAELPPRLSQLCGNRFEIAWTAENMRSYKKILPALERYPKDCLVTVDDDLAYRRDMLEKLWEAHRRFPGAIAGMRGHTMRFGGDGALLPYAQWRIEDAAHILEPRMDIFLTSGAGTLFPPGVLAPQATDWAAAKKLCPTADDIWLKFMSVIRGTKSLIAAKPEQLRYLPNTQNERLWDSNKSANDRQLAALIAKFAGSEDFFGKLGS
ncbi:MAG: glycosyltransferase [Oscillospiraceae bacterium]|jgi:glycosyltransferase involved in cell wall biosynthesis|nr:glycosyltransferase [Oscillospiraceae bacterium]